MNFLNNPLVAFCLTCEAPKVSSGKSEYLRGLFRTPLEEEDASSSYFEVQPITFERQGWLTSISGSLVPYSDNLRSINAC